MTTELRDMPTDHTTPITIMARLCEISGRQLLLMPLTPPVGQSRGHRLIVQIGDGPARTRLALVVSGQLAIRPSPEDHMNGATSYVAVQVRALAPKRKRRIPKDLADELQHRGVSLTPLPAHEIEQMLLLIGESSSAHVRAARIEAAVAAVVSRSHRDQ